MTQKKDRRKAPVPVLTRIDEKSRDVDEFQDIDKSEYPLLSVCVLCYKNSRLLPEMLDTIFAQSYPRIELIVSDDGSPDFSVDDVREYIGKKQRSNIEQVLVLKNEENLGTVKHIHKVLQGVSGEYVIFTAADDRFAGKDVSKWYVQGFQENPEAQWLVAQCAITTPDYKRTIYVAPTETDAPYFKSGDARQLFSRWSRRGMAVPCCMAFKREAFDLVGGIDLEYQYLEDWPLVLKLLRGGHAPVYLEKVAACHSTGGVTNSNDRYGIAIRKAFYDDKYLIFRKEVEPYQELISAEDQKLRKQYVREIMDRNYFLDIDYQTPSKAAKLKAALRKPRNFFWAFEVEYMKRKDKIKRKKMIAVSQVLFLLSFFFFQFEGGFLPEIIFLGMGIFDMLAGGFLFFCGFATYPLELYYKLKMNKRRKLVM